MNFSTCAKSLVSIIDQYICSYPHETYINHVRSLMLTKGVTQQEAYLVKDRQEICLYNRRQYIMVKATAIN
jgi:hypothetical protein